MIELDAVGKRFGAGQSARAVHAVRDVSLRLERGAIHAVAGPNGAGKTTLLGLILGFLHPSVGAVHIDGLPPRRYRLRHGVGYLPERLQLPARWRVRDTLTALATLDGGDDAVHRTRATLDRFGLAPFAERPVGTLSRGLLQRLGLAQALMAPHPLVVLDEPTEGLDPLGRILLREQLARLRADNTTVIVASQDLAELERVADRALVLGGGRVVETVELRRPAQPAEWTLVLAAGHAAVSEVFPDARPADGAETTAAADYRAFTVGAADAAELNLRLAALLAAGGIIVEVRPRAETLEARVEHAARPPDPQTE